LPYGQNVAPGSLKGKTIGYFNVKGDPFTDATTADVKAQVQRGGGKFSFCPVTDAATTLACLRNFKSAHVDGIIGFNFTPAANKQMCAAAPAVPIVALYIPMPPCSKSAVLANNTLTGIVAGERLGLLSHWHFNCKIDAYVQLGDSSAGIVNTQRMGGLLKGYERVCGTVPSNIMRVGDQNKTSTLDAAQTYMNNVLQAFPGKHAILVVGINDNAVEGAFAAARAQGRTGDVFAVGQGADPSFRKNIGNPQWVADAAYFPEAYGRVTVPVLVRMLHHVKVPSLIYMPTVAIDFSNVNLYYPGTVSAGPQ
jgi:ribose transport system substrate-binding protein